MLVGIIKTDEIFKFISIQLMGWIIWDEYDCLKCMYCRWKTCIFVRLNCNQAFCIMLRFQKITYQAHCIISQHSLFNLKLIVINSSSSCIISSLTQSQSSSVNSILVFQTKTQSYQFKLSVNKLAFETPQQSIVPFWKF